jgi:hypothetical protein
MAQTTGAFDAACAPGALNLASDDIRAILLMSNTTVGADFTAATVSALTLDESDDSTYARVALTTEAIAAMTGGQKFIADSIVFASLTGDGTRNYVGVLIYKHVGAEDSGNIPLYSCKFDATKVKESAQITATVPANGIASYTRPA